MAVMNVTVKGNIPDVNVPAGATEATLNVQVIPGAAPDGSGGNGEAGGFITVNATVTALGTVAAGPCTITITQP